MATNCVHCQIIQENTALKVYEDKETVCFLVNKPLAQGHCLIIPKKHYADIFDIEDAQLRAIASTTQTVSKILREKLGATGINILHASGQSAQQSVFHFHIHLVPRYDKDTLDTWPKSNYKEESLETSYKKLKQ